MLVPRAVFLGLIVLAAPVAAHAEPYAIVHSGQSRCYDARAAIPCPVQRSAAFFGQDAQNQINPARYRDNGDGTVSDLVTGLIWTKEFRRVGFAEATADAAASRVGGQSDWRVPTIKELYSLMNFDGVTGHARPEQTGAPPDARPYLDTSVFAFEYPRQGRFIDAQYVSSTVYLGQTMGRDKAFFGVNFADGRIKGYPQDGGPGRRVWYARYVRGNPAYGHNDFHDNGDGTIADRATGLTWTKADSGDSSFRPRLSATLSRDGRLDWREALAFCSGLDLAGHRDWRLPSAKELHSIVDYSRAPDATQSAAIAPIFQITSITDDLGRRDWPYFWSATSHMDGPGPGAFAVYMAFGRALGYLRPPPQLGGFTAEPVLLDVHGAGAQRSSPKSGNESMLPKGVGPQGDVLRIYNFARCVRRTG